MKAMTIVLALGFIAYWFLRLVRSGHRQDERTTSEGVPSGEEIDEQWRIKQLRAEARRDFPGTPTLHALERLYKERGAIMRNARTKFPDTLFAAETSKLCIRDRILLARERTRLILEQAEVTSQFSVLHSAQL